jgi:AcrR family transcriptional regulator
VARNSADKILDGLLLAVTRHGVKRISMSDVAREAGVSRGTLYRYFPDQEALLTALGDRVRDDWNTAVEKAVASESDMRRRPHVIVEVHRRFVAEHPELQALAEAEPRFALSWFRSNERELKVSAREALAPVIGRRTAKERRDLDEITDLVWRLSITYFLVPPGDGEGDPEWLATVLESYLKLYFG